MVAHTGYAWACSLVFACALPTLISLFTADRYVLLEVVGVVVDASAGASKEAHDMAVERMIQAGAVPITWQVYLGELQRDWARQQIYAAVNQIAQEHAGAWGQGINYAISMLHKEPL